MIKKLVLLISLVSVFVVGLCVPSYAYYIDNDGNLQSDNLFDYSRVVYDDNTLINTLNYDDFYVWGFEFKVGNNTNIGQIMFRLYQNNNVVYTDTYDRIGTDYFNVLHGVTNWTNFSEFDLYIYRNGNNSDYGLRLNLGYLDDIIEDGILYCSFNFIDINIVGGHISSKIINLQFINDSIVSYKSSFEPYGQFYSQYSYDSNYQNGYNAGENTIGAFAFINQIILDYNNSKIYLTNWNDYFKFENGSLIMTNDLLEHYYPSDSYDGNFSVTLDFISFVINKSYMPSVLFSGDWENYYYINYYNGSSVSLSQVDGDNLYYVLESYYVSTIKFTTSHAGNFSQFKIVYDTTYTNGYSAGYESGHTDGYIEGSSRTSDDYQKTIKILKSEIDSLQQQVNETLGWKSFGLAMVDLPLESIHRMLNFSVLGLNVFEALVGIITVLAILWVVKRLWK